MAKAGKWIVAGAGCALAAGFAIPWPAGESTARDVIRQFATAAGLEPIAIGAASISLLPSPRIRLHNVAVSDASRTLLVNASQMEGKLRLLPLVAGRVELAGLSLYRPEIEIDLGKIVLTRQGPIARTARVEDRADAVQAESERLGAIAVRNGHARIRNSAAGTEEVELSAIDAVLDWRSPRTPAALGGKANWRGRSFEIAALLARPADLLRGQNSPLTLSLAAASAALRLEGDLAMSPRWQFTGVLKGSTSAAGEIAGLLRLPLPPEGLSKIHADGTARINAQGLQLSGANLDVEGNQLSGTLGVLRAEKSLAVTGTLATSSLVIDPRRAGLPEIIASNPATGSSWSARQFNPALLSGFNMDLRLSVGEMRIGRIAFSEVALSSLVQDGRLEISLSSAKAYDGVLKARLGFAGPAQPNLRAYVQVENVAAATLLRDAIGLTRLTGVLTGEAEIRSSGNSILQAVQRAQGNLQATIARGSLQGLELDRALKQAQTNPLSLPSEIRNGSTAFTRASVTGVIENGLLKLGAASAQSDSLIISAAGLVSLVSRSLELDIEAAKPAPLAGAGAAQTNPPAGQATLAAPGLAPAAAPLSAQSTGQILRLDLRGPWSNPELQLDAESLINNSEAAAPLGRSAPRRSGAAPKP